MDNSTKVGQVTGTGAAMNISLGFIPDYVEIVNITDGNRITRWFSGISVDGGGNLHTPGALANLAAPDGIARFTGTASAPRGFTIGAATSQAGKVLAYLAVRTSSGV